MIRDHGSGARRVAAVVTMAAILLEGAWLVLLAIGVARGWVRLDEDGVGQTLGAATMLGLTFPVVAWVIIRRQPTNLVGWVFLVVGSWQALNTFAYGYSTMAFVWAGGDLPLAAELSWVGVWAWVPGFVLFITLGVLLFPDGRLPSRRWWPVAAMALVALTLLAVPIAVASWPYRGLQLVQQQMHFGEEIPTDPVLSVAFALRDIGALTLLAATLGSVAGLAVRFRHSIGVERQQLKWFTFAALVDGILLVIWQTVPLDPLPGTVSGLVLAPLLPVATAAAILRYRLYDIDRVVSRTIGYAIVTGVLGATFVGIVLLAQVIVDSLLPQVTETGTPAVAASTLAVAALFQPLRRRIQATVDRRFDRARVDRDRSIVKLGDRLRDAVELDAIRADVLGTINTTVRPANVTIWLRHHGSLAREA